MQSTINFTQNNAESGGYRDDVNRRMARLFKRFPGLMPTLLPALLVCLLLLMWSGTTVAQTSSQPTKAATPSDAVKAFDKMKTLSGSWQGTVMNIPINFTIRPVSSGTVILQEGNTEKGPPDHEITMFYVDGDRLLATHYCDAGNRSNLEGKISADGKSVEFSFLDVAGSTKGGLVKHIMITMIDADKHVEEFTFIMPNGKPVELRGEFTRTK